MNQTKTVCTLILNDDPNLILLFKNGLYIPCSSQYLINKKISIVSYLESEVEKEKIYYFKWENRFIIFVDMIGNWNSNFLTDYMSNEKPLTPFTFIVNSLFSWSQIQTCKFTKHVFFYGRSHCWNVGYILNYQNLYHIQPWIKWSVDYLFVKHLEYLEAKWNINPCVEPVIPPISKNMKCFLKIDRRNKDFISLLCLKEEKMSIFNKVSPLQGDVKFL